MVPVDSPERLARRAVEALPTSGEEKRPAKSDTNKLQAGDLENNVLEKDSNWVDMSRGSTIDDCVTLEPTLQHYLARLKVEKLMETALTQMASRLDDRITHVANHALINILEYFGMMNN